MNHKGITLIALVITIIVLIILAGVSITLTFGDNGIITKAKKAVENTQIAQVEEEQKLEDLYNELQNIENGTNSNWDKGKNVNKPKLAEGMTPIKFDYPTDTEMGKTIETKETDKDWYDYGTTYETKKWANAKTKDGSMWVWIPRFAYKINESTQTTDVVFLIGTTDVYYDKEGKLQLAKRARTTTEKIDTSTGYTVHPAFTDESSIDFRNGGWDKELTGIWIAKFEAGYASGNNDAEVKPSNIPYTQAFSYVQTIERSSTTSENGNEVARNWLDGIYGQKSGNDYTFKDGIAPQISYPVFQGTTFSMNYINHNDAYNIAMHLTDDENIYGLTKSTDSHLMKNSEWGAVAYLSKSQYGLNNTDITVNNVNLNSNNKVRDESTAKGSTDDPVSVYAITGCTTNSTNTGEIVETLANIKALTANTKSANGVYVWNQKDGQSASSTGTIYGIYDLSGGLCERTAAYVANGHGNLKTYGSSITYNGDNLKTKSTKYTTVYPYDTAEGTSKDPASQKNYKYNDEHSLIYGDSVLETSSSNAGTSDIGWNTSSWYSDYSYFPAYNLPFFGCGGHLWDSSYAGIAAFIRYGGYSYYHYGFRAVLVP